ncbi:MAG: efflux RND transporter periplasmic adaptor subunit [Verrucomicrobia bacterium]|nr:efflux RND transporter periplasmic adaptor subunit [Verrucomicrobiota bacterium]
MKNLKGQASVCMVVFRRWSNLRSTSGSDARVLCALPAALGCALLAAGLTACGKSEAAKTTVPGESPARTVRVAPAVLRPMEHSLPVTGTLLAQEDATIAAQVAGQLETLQVDVGDSVKAGQELALIDTTSYEAFARQSAANLARATASAANAAQNLKRMQNLQQDKIASTSDLDLAVAEDSRARAEVKAAEATEAIARLNLDRSRVRAPFDGAIAQRIASAGEYVTAGSPIVRLVKTDPLRLRLEVPERESPSVRLGQTVRVMVEGDTNVYRGRLARIAPAIREADRMLQVEADVPNPGGLRAGLFARAHIIVNESDNAVSVPPGALTTFAGVEKVVVVNDGKAVEKTVRTGRRGSDWIEIVSGLKAGEKVVLEPTGIRTGQPLIIEGAPPDNHDTESGG